MTSIAHLPKHSSSQWDYRTFALTNRYKKPATKHNDFSRTTRTFRRDWQDREEGDSPVPRNEARHRGFLRGDGGLGSTYLIACRARPPSKSTGGRVCRAARRSLRSYGLDATGCT